jgi:cytochrome b561
MGPLPPDRSSDRQHLAVALLTLWLLLTSPWVSMLRRIPPSAGWLDYVHVVLGLLTLVLGLAYAWSCTRGGRWRLYFPWAPSQLPSVGRDLADLLRGRLPSAEGGGLFGLIEGLLLLLLVATALTGAGWLATQGSDAALAWRGYHGMAARGLIGLLVLHVVTVSLHLLDFLRD